MTDPGQWFGLGFVAGAAVMGWLGWRYGVRRP